MFIETRTHKDTITFLAHILPQISSIFIFLNVLHSTVFSYFYRSFVRNLETYKMLTRLKPPREAFDDQGRGLVSTLEYTYNYFKTKLQSKMNSLSKVLNIRFHSLCDYETKKKKLKKKSSVLKKKYYYYVKDIKRNSFYIWDNCSCLLLSCRSLGT